MQQEVPVRRETGTWMPGTACVLGCGYCVFYFFVFKLVWTFRPEYRVIGPSCDDLQDLLHGVVTKSKVQFGGLYQRLFDQCHGMKQAL